MSGRRSEDKKGKKKTKKSRDHKKRKHKSHSSDSSSDSASDEEPKLLPKALDRDEWMTMVRLLSIHCSPPLFDV